MKKVMMNENLNLQKKVNNIPNNWKGTNLPNPEAFVKAVTTEYSTLYEALAK